MPDLHDTIEAELDEVIPRDGLDDADGVTHTSCSLALRIENALRQAGHLPPEDDDTPDIRKESEAV